MLKTRKTGLLQANIQLNVCRDKSLIIPKICAFVKKKKISFSSEIEKGDRQQTPLRWLSDRRGEIRRQKNEVRVLKNCESDCII